MPVLRRIGLLATCASPAQNEIRAIRDAALAWHDGRIVWVGTDADWEREQKHAQNPVVAGALQEGSWDAGGRMVIPGLIDAHTHLAFGGWRADELARKAAGASYREIARGGGGIRRTVAETRGLDGPALLARSEIFLREMVALGVTTVEAKSGYGLDRETELRQLRVYAALDRGGPDGRSRIARIVPTFLGAHAVPPEYDGRRAAYLDLLVNEMIPTVAKEGLARFCDVFVEETAFSVEEARQILGAARRAGLALKLHVDQLDHGGGAALAAELKATSADHLEHVSDEGIRQLADAGTVAVLLPLAGLYERQPPAPARRLLDAGVPVAVATNFNPGTAPSLHLPLALTLACVQLRMTPAEALQAATLQAARALGLDGEIGSLEPGKRADLAVIDAPDVGSWLYHFRANACVATIFDGEIRHGSLPFTAGSAEDEHPP